jgi:SAM-dependent methyltransferase/ABC-type transporter Mla MlaB component
MLKIDVRGFNRIHLLGELTYDNLKIAAGLLKFVSDKKHQIFLISLTEVTSVDRSGAAFLKILEQEVSLNESVITYTDYPDIAKNLSGLSEGAFSWAYNEYLEGHISSVAEYDVLLHAKHSAIVNGGFYHNYELTEYHSTNSIGGFRRNVPFEDENAQSYEWQLIRALLPDELSGKRVVDIGSNDGYFSIACARDGADVTSIERGAHAIYRLGFLSNYFSVDHKIHVVEGDFPDVGLYETVDADIILALGVIYHLYNLEEGLAPILESRAITVIEGAITNNRMNNFDPVNHNNSGQFEKLWIEEIFESNGYSVSWIDDWQKFADSHLVHGSDTRQMMLAVPR